MPERDRIGAVLEEAMKAGKLPPLANALLATAGSGVRETVYDVLHRARALQPWGAEEREFWSREARQAVGRFVLGSAGREEFVTMAAGIVSHFIEHPDMLDQ